MPARHQAERIWYGVEASHMELKHFCANNVKTAFYGGGGSNHFGIFSVNRVILKKCDDVKLGRLLFKRDAPETNFHLLCVNASTNQKTKRNTKRAERILYDAILNKQKEKKKKTCVEGKWWWWWWCSWNRVRFRHRTNTRKCTPSLPLRLTHFDIYKNSYFINYPFWKTKGNTPAKANNSKNNRLIRNKCFFFYLSSSSSFWLCLHLFFSPNLIIQLAS